MNNILAGINSPDDLKKLNNEQLNALCEEIRSLIIETVSNNGGHLSSNLGVVELSVALALAFDLPKDSIVWDVGHQSYPYKILTGRSDEFKTIRTGGGLSGFPSNTESEYDLFTTGHSSTSVSSALGVAIANQLNGDDNFVVAIIGDGALSGGLAYEGLNNAGRLHKNFIVILNDNNMSISRNVGSMARYLTYIRTKSRYIKIKKNVEYSLEKIPLIGKKTASLLRKSKNAIKKIFYNSTIFDDFGFAYYGPFDGHNVETLKDTLKSAKLINKPVLLHVRTNKGKGYPYAEEAPDIFHGVSAFNVESGLSGEKTQTFSDVFGETLCNLAEKNAKICAITAAMRYGTGLSEFHNKYKNRFFDVGIAEEHAVTFSGGLSAKGLLPVFTVYSTFLQRSYDEIIHDLSLQGSKAVIAIDRAGIVGEDGKTHQGIFDTAFLQSIPNITVYSPSYFCELKAQLEYLVNDVDGLSAIRYPRGKELFKPACYKNTLDAFSVYGDKNAGIAIVTYGRLFSFAMQACEQLKKQEISIKVIKLNKIIPIDKESVRTALNCKVVFFFEEGVAYGGIGEHFARLLLEEGYAGKYILKAIENPFFKHDTMMNSLKDLGLTDETMVSEIQKFYIERERN